MGFGVEAGTWKKDAGKFSYFIGTSMVWTGINNTTDKDKQFPKSDAAKFLSEGAISN